jgi:hypothetical protein
VSGYVQREFQFTVPAVSLQPLDESCPAGTVLMGGGLTLLSSFDAGGGQIAPAIISNGPVSSVTWETKILNTSPNTLTYGLWLMCATAIS